MFYLLLSLGAAALHFLGLQSQQQASSGDNVVATYRLAGKTTALSRQQVAMELGRRMRRTKAADDTLTHLIERRVVEAAARKHKLMPKPAAVRQRMVALERQLLDHKQSLKKHLRKQRMSQQTFMDNLAVVIAQERLVLQARGESTDRRLTPKEVSTFVPLWIREAMNKAKIERSNDLPAGVLARVEGEEIRLSHLGETLFMRVSGKQIEDAVKDMVFRSLVEQMAQDSGIELTKDDLRGYVDLLRKRHEKSKHKDIPFSRWIPAQKGMSVEAFMRGRFVRTQVLFKKLAARRITDEMLNEQLKGNRHDVLRRHGARRQISVILLRATHKPSKLIPRDFAVAEREAKRLHEQLSRFPQRFAELARKFSDHPTKVRGGSVGWKHEIDPNGSVPQAALAAAFKLPAGQISKPARTQHGYYLLKVDGIESTPPEELMRKRLRQRFIQAMLRQMYAGANVQLKL